MHLSKLTYRRSTPFKRLYLGNSSGSSVPLQRRFLLTFPRYSFGPANTWTSTQTALGAEVAPQGYGWTLANW
jgi:hypothetical protein